jgi:hypothetical protein
VSKARQPVFEFKSLAPPSSTSIIFLRIGGAIGVRRKEPAPHSPRIASADPLLPIGPATVALSRFATYRGA